MTKNNYSFCMLFFFLVINTAYSQTVIANLNGNNVSFTEGSSSVLIDNGSNATVTNDGAGYDTGNITVAITDATSNDDLLIITGSGVELSSGMTESSTVTVSSTLIGSIAVGGTGQDGQNLVITLNSSADDALLATLIHNLAYTNNSDDPPSSRSITLTITNTTPATSDNAVITVSITGVNDAPTLTATGTNPTFTEDGQQADLFSSITASTIESGQAITELKLIVTNVNDESDEILSIDESSVELTDANSLTTTTNSISVSVSLSGTTATVTLSKSAGLNTDTVQSVIGRMTYRNENNTPNTSNRVVTLTSIKDDGGTDNSGVDTGILSIVSTITVVAANDAPVLNTTPALSLSGIMEDLGNPLNESIDNSTLVSSLIDESGSLSNYSDAEGDLPGVGIIDVNSGSLWYSTDDGTSWTELTGTVSETSALVLLADASTRVYFKPTTNVSGTVNDAIVFKAWDRTSGQANGTPAINTTTGTSFSSTTDDVSIEITDINDAPTLSVTPNDPTYTEGDAAVDLFSAVSFSTVESGQNVTKLVFRMTNVNNGMNELLYLDGSDVGLGIGDSVITSSNGMKAMVTNEDTTTIWTYITLTDPDDVNPVGFSATDIQNLIENMTYKNTSTNPYVAERKIVIFSVMDDGGTANGGSDASVYLDSTTITVISVNDVPVLDNTKTPEFNGVPENISDPTNGSTLYSTLVSKLVDDVRFFNTNTLDNYSDGDSDPPGLAVIGVNASGTLWYSTDDGSSWTELSGIISETSALVVYADNTTRLYYKPDNGVSGTVTDAITIKAWDRTAGGTNGSTGINTTSGTAFSLDTDDIEITVADINYAPNLSATGSDPDFTEGGAAVDLFSSVTAETPESGQLLLELQLTVSNVLNGGEESLMIDGTEVQLINGNTLTTSNNGMTVNVSLPAFTATVTVSKTGGVSETIIENIIDGLTYKNNSNNPGNTVRTVTLISLQDDGGSANGSDTDTYSITSDVSMLPINESPVITNLDGDNASVVVGGAADYIDVDQDALITNEDSPDNYDGNIKIVQTSGTANGTWSFDGSVVKSGADATIDTSETVVINGIEVGTVSATNDGEAGDTLVINFGGNATNTRISYLINYLKYYVPSGLGDRIFSLTLDDGDGNLNGGDSSATVSFTVTTTQNPPVITGLNGDSHTYVKGSILILDDGLNANVTDSDSPDFDGGELTVSISSGLEASEDVLLISTSGTVSLDAGMTVGSNVIVEAVTIGTISFAGSSGDDLVVTFNGNSTIARIVSLLRSIAYNNSNNDSPSIDTRMIDFTISDGAGVGSAVSETSQVEIILNSKPTTTGIPDLQVASNAENSNIDLSQYFDDIEDGPSGLAYSIINISNPILFTSVFISGHTLVLDYGLSTNGTSYITIRATDTGDFYIESTFTTIVGTGINNEASATSVIINTGGTVIENGTLFINSQMLSAKNSDGNSTGLTYSITQAPRHGSMEKTGNLLKASSTESFSFTQDDLAESKVKYIHDGSETGSDTLKFIVTDEEDNSSNETSFVITIISINDAPIVNTLSPIRMNEDEIYTFNISDWYTKINDPDDADSTLSITISCDDESISLSSSDNKKYTITTSENYFGSTILGVVVSDGELSDTSETELIVQPVNDLPQIEGLPSELTLINGIAYSLLLKDIISDEETPDSLLNISFSVTPDSVLFDYKKKTGVLTLFVYGSFTGEASLSITIIDEAGGSCSESIALQVVIDPTGINKIDGMPDDFTLFHNYPNPFNPSTIIRYGLPETEHVRLAIYDILGNQVAILVDQDQSPGYYEKTWNAFEYSSGIYFYVFSAGNYREIKKMMLLK